MTNAMVGVLGLVVILLGLLIVGLLPPYFTAMTKNIITLVTIIAGLSIAFIGFRD